MDIQKIIGKFDIPGKYLEGIPYGNGHINDTYCISMEETKGECRRYILQKINRHVFREPDKLMENIQHVTSYLKEMIRKNGGDPERETLQVIPGKSGDSYLLEDGEYWRVYKFIEDSLSLEKVEKPEDFYESAVAFGRFQRLLSGFDASSLYETIPDFHNTRNRIEKLHKAVQEDRYHRVQEAADELAFIKERENEAGLLVDLLEKGELPLRVTHNDTKLNNVMLDNKTRKGICVIDLDTVMPGLALYDFGDSIRFGANTAAEDEQDLSKVSCDLNLFEWFVKGYLEGCANSLTPREVELLPMGAKIMTLECGIRFLTDYLEGDVYFKIHREGHNLDRARTQLRLVRDMEVQWNRLVEIVNKYK